MQREDVRADVTRRLVKVSTASAALNLVLQLMDEAATRARDEAFAEVALHLKHLVEAAALDDPAERRRKAEALLAQISADISNEGKPLSMRLAEARADGLREAVGVFVRQAIARGHRNSQTIDLAARECEALAIQITAAPVAEGPHA
jgi:hypothetical protein